LHRKPSCHASTNRHEAPNSILCKVAFGITVIVVKTKKAGGASYAITVRTNSKLVPLVMVMNHNRSAVTARVRVRVRLGCATWTSFWRVNSALSHLTRLVFEGRKREVTQRVLVQFSFASTEF